MPQDINGFHGREVLNRSTDALGSSVLGNDGRILWPSPILEAFVIPVLCANSRESSVRPSTRRLFENHIESRCKP